MTLVPQKGPEQETSGSNSRGRLPVELGGAEKISPFCVKKQPWPELKSQSQTFLIAGAPLLKLGGPRSPWSMEGLSQDEGGMCVVPAEGGIQKLTQ